MKKQNPDSAMKIAAFPAVLPSVTSTTARTVAAPIQTGATMRAACGWLAPAGTAFVPVLAALILAAALTTACGGTPSHQPNVILCMADDLGWGDTGYNGHPHIRTPHLDQLSKEGLRFDRFYAAAPVCSPTRGSCLTGRHPYRYGITHANEGHLKTEEITLAEMLKAEGYATGHFGKWHLGTMTTKIQDSVRGVPGGTAHYSPPWEHGFDVCFSTEAKVPTRDPMKNPENGRPYGTHYWTGPGLTATGNLEGDDSRVIMDRVLPFIRDAVSSRKPFLAVIWFHAPHVPVVRGPENGENYSGLPGADYMGCVSAMDKQIGRLHNELKELGLARDTLLWFCSDNGPEGQDESLGTTGGLRGRKRSLHEGGIRVPALLVWPANVREPRITAVPCSTSDIFPTLLDALGRGLPGSGKRPYDGISLLPLLEGRMTERPRPIAFESKRYLALIDNRYKTISRNRGKKFELYDLLEDPGEEKDISAEQPQIIEQMKTTLDTWRRSCRESARGLDYSPGSGVKRGSEERD